MFQKMFENVRSKNPLIHNITNYVTVNDCANIVIACGASPIMADDKDEVEDITNICDGLNINIGTLNSRTIESMLIAGKNMHDAASRASELLEMLGLKDRSEHKPSELSGGEKQRIAVARALANKPDVILADEPSGSLDTRNKEELHNLFFKLRDMLGQTFVIVTHDEQLAALADRRIHIKDGMISF